MTEKGALGDRPNKIGNRERGGPWNLLEQVSSFAQLSACLL